MESKELENSRIAVLKAIIKRRNELGISQMDLALLINMSFNAYYKVESGRTKLDTKRLFKILKVLKISPNTFFKDFK
jgi:transcriptional regulator with XRE-family HTH domain